MAILTSKKYLDIHAESINEFSAVQDAVRDERRQCLEDRRFYSIAGAMWEGSLEQQFENKPRFEINKIHLAVIRIINEYRNNRITVDFRNASDADDEELADICDDLYRADERDSQGEEAYDNAFEEAVGGGIGAWRLCAEYEDDEDIEDDRQRIEIEPIYDADTTVFFDLQAKRQDKSDAKKCWVLTPYTRDAYRSEFDDDPATWPKEITDTQFDWQSGDTVYVAEYYVVEYAKDTVHVYEHIDGEEERFLEEELTDELKNRLIAIGSKEIKTKPIKRKKVHKYIESGAGILEDCGYIAGPNIPIVVTYGKRWVVDNVERCMGHVRLPKDSSRVKNMQVSKLAEISALSPVEKPIFTPEQVAGHELRWAEDNVKNYPYMLINSITDMSGNEAISGPVGYTKPPAIPPAMAALLNATEGDINDLLGNQQNGEQLVGNISTETAHLIQNRLDMQTFIYLSNFAKAMRRSGEIWLGMAKSVYVEQGRELETIGDNGDRGKAVLMQPMIDPEDGEMEYKNDLSKAKMKVSVDVGPSSSTKKAATVRSLTEVSKYTQDPETLSILNAMIMMNMDGEGISDVRNFFRKKLIRLGVILPNDKEKEELIAEMQNMPPDPNSEYLTAAAENERAKAVKAQADTIYTQAKTDSERADTLKTMSDIESDKTKQAIDIIDKLGPNVVPRQ